MLLDIDVTIQTRLTANITYDSEGIQIMVWTASQTTERSNKQPLSGEIAFKEYGISDAGITNLFFLKTSSTALENGRIIHGTKTFSIYRIEQFQNHWEAIVRPVVS